MHAQGVRGLRRNGGCGSRCAAIFAITITGGCIPPWAIVLQSTMSRALPNKGCLRIRGKIPGALVLKEAVVSCPGGHGTFVHYSCAAARVARSLSAIR